MNAFSFEKLRALPIIGILRGFELRQVLEIITAGVRGGLTNLEITMNSPGAAHQIREAAALAQGDLNIGAGTVTDLVSLDQALSSGASFIVTPTLQPAVIERCVTPRVPVFPGAFTPTEILRAWELGATMVKVFPSETVGPRYIRSLKAPLPDLLLLPTGGVDLASLSDYIQAGANGFGVGSPLFGRPQIEAGDWAWVEDRCRAFAEAYQRAVKETNC